MRRVRTVRLAVLCDRSARFPMVMRFKYHFDFFERSWLAPIGGDR